MLVFFFFFLRINLTINVAHPVFLMHIQSLLSGYTPALHVPDVEPHMLSSTYLSRLVKDAELLDNLSHTFIFLNNDNRRLLCNMYIKKLKRLINQIEVTVFNRSFYLLCF